MSNETLILKSAVATNSDIAITDLPFANVDALEGAKHFQNESFEGVKTFKSAKTGATAFGTATVKGDEVPIVIGSSEIYDEQFKYGVYADGQIKTADEIFAPDQDGNYDISDYTAVPATTLLERLGTFPTGSNNTIRINKDTAAKYVEGFRTENLLNNSYNSINVKNVDITYNNGVYTFNGTSDGTAGGRNLNVYGFNDILLPAGNYYLNINNPISDADLLLYINDKDKTGLPPITNISGTLSIKFSLEKDTNIRIGFNFPPSAVTFDNVTVLVSITKEEPTICHPIEKLDYVVAQANAKGYDVTIANNESDVKLIEKVEFDGTKYIDSGIKVNSDTRPIELDLTAEAKENIAPYIFGYRSVTNASYRKFGLYISAKSSSNNGNIIYSNGSIGSVLVPVNVSSELGSFLKKTRKQILIQENRKVFVNNIEVRTFSEQTYTSINTAPIGQGIADDTGIINRITDIEMEYYSCLIADNLFIPANNGTTDGMVNIKDMSFHPLISIN